MSIEEIKNLKQSKAGKSFNTASQVGNFYGDYQNQNAFQGQMDMYMYNQMMNSYGGQYQMGYPQQTCYNTFQYQEEHN